MLCVDEITVGRYRKRFLSRRRPAQMEASSSHHSELPASLELPSLTPDIFQIMYEYSHLKRATFSSYKQCCLTLVEAKNIGMSGLGDTCRSYLWNHAYPDNVFTLLEEIKDKKEDLLYETACKIMQIKAEELIKSRRFLDIDLYLAYDIVCLENLNIPSEMFLLENMIRWADYQIWSSDGGIIPYESRIQLQLSLILPHIRFLTIHPDDYNKMPHWLFKPNEKHSLLTKIWYPDCDEPVENIVLDSKLKTRTFKMPDMFYVYATDERLVDYQTGRILEHCHDDEVLVELQNDSFDALFRTQWCIKTLSQVITGIRVATQINDEAFLNHQFYDEFLSIFLFDAETDRCIYSQKFIKNINYAASTLIIFDNRVNLFDYEFIVARNQQLTNVVAKIIYHKSGFYPKSPKMQLEIVEFLNLEDDEEDDSLKIPF